MLTRVGLIRRSGEPKNEFRCSRRVEAQIHARPSCRHFDRCRRRKLAIQYLLGEEDGGVDFRTTVTVDMAFLFQIEVVESAVDIGWDVRVRTIFDSFGRLQSVVAFTDEHEDIAGAADLDAALGQESAKSHLGFSGYHLRALARQVYKDFQLVRRHCGSFVMGPTIRPQACAFDRCRSLSDCLGRQHGVENSQRQIQAKDRNFGYCCLCRQQVWSRATDVNGAAMKKDGLGFLLQHLRARRGLSLRELGQLAQTDHAYIYRLEQGEKGAPSEDVLLRLIRALKAERREAEMLRFLAAHPETAQDLVVEVLNDPTVRYEEFAAAAGAAFRGKARPNYAQLLARVRRILSEENGDG